MSHSRRGMTRLAFTVVPSLPECFVSVRAPCAYGPGCPFCAAYEDALTWARAINEATRRRRARPAPLVGGTTA